MNPLLVPDLIHCILDCLAISLPEDEERVHYSVDPVKRTTLVALARTCRALSEPSLDRLWRRLDSLLPLIRSFARVVDEDRVKTPPSPAQWLVICRYSPRIQELTLGAESLSLNFLQCTNLSLDNLRVLRWKSADPIVGPNGGMRFPFHSVSFLSTLLTPQIVTLEAALNTDKDTKLQSFFENFSLLCPNLRSFRFTISSDSNEVPVAAKHALSRAISERTNWQRVEVEPTFPVDAAAFKLLGMSSTLRAVALTLDPDTIGQDEAVFEHTDTPFCNVKKLSLTLHDCLDFATHLLRRQGQAFRSFSVTIRGTRITATEVSAFFAAVASPQRVNSLRSLSLLRPQNVLSGASSSANATEELSYGTLFPIISLVHLRQLIINLDHPVTINDNDFAHLVHNWPHLEVFWLAGWRGEHPANSITLRALLSLLASCKKLYHICISLDATKVPSDKSTDVDLCSQSVTHLLFPASPIKDPGAVEEFLFKHFPRALVDVTLITRSFVGVNRKYATMWSHVNNYRFTRY